MTVELHRAGKLAPRTVRRDGADCAREQRNHASEVAQLVRAIARLIRGLDYDVVKSAALMSSQ